MKIVRTFLSNGGWLILVGVFFLLMTFLSVSSYSRYNSSEKEVMLEIKSRNDTCAKEAQAFYTGLPTAERHKRYWTQGRNVFSRYEPVEVVSPDRVEHLLRSGDTIIVDVRFCSNGFVGPFAKDYLAFFTP